MSEKWTAENVRALIADPEQAATVGVELWVKANKGLIDEMGAEAWLRMFVAAYHASSSERPAS